MTEDYKNKKNEEYVIHKRHEGVHDLRNIWKLQDCDMPSISGEGQMICKTLYLSVDPYLSSGVKQSALGGEVTDIGTTQYSISIVEVVASSHPAFPVGTIYVARHPWRRYILERGDAQRIKIIKRPSDSENIFDKLGVSAALGALGMPCQTAYYGCVDVGKFTKEDILVVSGAAGAVGTVAGQIAKHVQQCKKVIGTAGGKDKCDYLVNVLGFDAAIDYKEYDTKEKMAKKLQEVAGEPITCYFDNTGGHVTDAVFEIMGRHGRIIVCGQISSYNKSVDESNTFPNYLAKTIYRGLSILGFVVSDFVDRNEKEFFVDMPKYIEEGKVKTKETRVNGFDKIPEAYEMLFTGGNIGKIVVHV